MKTNNHYHIMTSCDDHLASYITVNLTALSTNLPDDTIDFYLLHSRISRHNIEMLQALCALYDNISFHEIIVPNPEDYAKLSQYGGGWAYEAYFAFCAHHMLPATTDRVLYLDAGDTLVVDDIAPYYHADFQGNSLIVTGIRYKAGWRGEPILFTSDDLADFSGLLPEILRGIFNSGSFVMDLKKLRRDNLSLDDYIALTEALSNIFGKNDKYIYHGDQGLMSAAFVGDIQYYKYPQIKDLYYIPYNFCMWYFDQYTKQPDYMPAILHYAGAPKPWKGAYPIFLERFQKREELFLLKDLKPGQEPYYQTWYQYALQTDQALTRIGY